MSDTITVLMLEDAFRILEEIGVKCFNQEIIDIFESSYLAAYDYTTNRIHITGDLVKCCLSSIPKKSKFPVSDKSFGTGGIAAFINQGDDYIKPDIDIHVGEIARISQEFNLPFMFRTVGANLTPLEEVKQINVMRKYFDGYLYVRAETSDGIWRTKLEHDISGKICTTHSIIKSPLTFNEVGKNIDIFLNTVRKGIPVYLTTMPITCLTGPSTLYGIGILALAEFLAGLSLTQLLYPGLTVVNGAYPAASDVRQGYRIGLGSIYHNLVNHTIAQVSEKLDIPSIQSGCTISNEFHDPVEGSTDFETERGYKLWNTWNGWHQLRHSVGFVNQLISFDINKMRRDCNCMSRVIENNEKWEDEVEEIYYDNEAFDCISECSETGNFKEHWHTTKNIGILE